MRSPKRWILGLCLLAIAQAGMSPQQARPREQVPALSATPYSLGERLVYVVKWDPPWYLFFLPSMEAGEIDLQLAGETEYQGQKAWKIIFNAHSSGALLKMSGIKIDDEYVFITDPETFCSLNAVEKNTGRQA